MMRRMTKPQLVRQHDVDHRSGETMICRHWCRRNGLDHRIRAGPVGGQRDVATRIMVIKEATSKEGVIGQYHKSEAVLARHEPLTEIQGKNGHQATTKHQATKARDDQMIPKASVVVIVNQVRLVRRVAIQHGNNDNNVSARREARGEGDSHVKVTGVLVVPFRG